MNPEKFAELQMQIKQNNHDYQNFLNDLDTWETDVKHKEQRLKQEKKENEDGLPPIRNSLEKKKKKKKKKQVKANVDTSSQEKKRINSYDYRSWDKFDVDAACEEVDNDSPDVLEEEYETDEEWEMERNKLLAIQHKEQGNQYFKKEDFINAVESYTKGIECDPTNAVLPANRAMALLKQDKYAAAELDCSKSIALDGAYIKAYHRRGTARAALKKYEEAKDDFLQVLDKEPNNKPAKAELEKVERILNPPKILQSKTLETSDVGIVKAIYKAPHQRSQKPLRRIIIEEIGEDEKETQRKLRLQDIHQSQSETKKNITEKDNISFEKLVASKSDESNPSKEHATSHSKTESKELVQKVKKCDMTPKKENKTAVTSKDMDFLKTNISSLHTLLVGNQKSKSPQDPPSTSYQFQADWKMLKNSTAEFYNYFQAIDASKLPKLIGEFLDADILSKIISTLKFHYIPNELDPYPVLSNLCDVKRFSMNSMFLSTEDKKNLLEVVASMKRNNIHKTEAIDKIAVKYGV